MSEANILLKACERYKSQKNAKHFLKGFDESHLKDHRPTGGNLKLNSYMKVGVKRRQSIPSQHQILIHQRQIKCIRIVIKANNIRMIDNSFKWII